MKYTFLLFVLLAVSSVNLFGATVSFENWDSSSTSGWLPNTTRSEVEVLNSGGNPYGFLRCYEVENTYAIGTLNRDSDYIGNYVLDGITGVSVDVFLESGNFYGAWFRFRDSENGWLFPVTETFPLGSWISNLVIFDPTWSDEQARLAGWLTPHDINSSNVASNSFRETMQDVRSAEIRFEGYASDLAAGVDNYALISEPTIILDQEQAIMTNDFSIAIGGNSEQKLAQVVTAGMTGYLTRIGLPMKVGQGSIKIGIMNVENEVPSDVELSSTIVTYESTENYNWNGFNYFLFDNPAYVVAGQQYAITICANGNPLDNYGGFIPGPEGDSYSGGSAFYDSRPNQPGWIQFFSGRDDLPFQTFMSIVEPTTISLDIKPQSCPNPLNTKSKGVLPVAILGTEDFDIAEIDLASIRLEGVAPLRSSYEDVSTPVIDEVDCTCTTDGPDGYMDMTLKFSRQELLAVLGEVENSQEWLLHLTGSLYDGTEIEGTDCILIQKKGKK